MPKTAQYPRAKTRYYRIELSITLTSKYIVLSVSSLNEMIVFFFSIQQTC